MVKKTAKVSKGLKLGDVVRLRGQGMAPVLTVTEFTKNEYGFLTGQVRCTYWTEGHGGVFVDVTVDAHSLVHPA